MKKGIILLNLGTPLSPSTKDVRLYLDEFLNDPYVIDLPYVFRKILVNGIILNTRPKKSAEAYAQIWTDAGSPLMIHTKDLAKKVIDICASKSKTASNQNDEYFVEVGMRYGEPSLRKAIENLKSKEVEEITFFPLYPQYSYAASESSIAEFLKQKEIVFPKVKVKIIEDFYNEKAFISALASSMRAKIDEFKPDCLFLSYHGIPERQIPKIKQAPEFCCAKDASLKNCCDQVSEKNLKCYKAQCYETSRLLAKELQFDESKVITAFQSRLGRTKWIEPYTDFLLKDLPKEGKKRILVASPSFTADCLETLEEIKIRYEELFKESGGEEFEYLPCLNSRDDFSQFVYERMTR